MCFFHTAPKLSNASHPPQSSILLAPHLPPETFDLGSFNVTPSQKRARLRFQSIPKSREPSRGPSPSISIARSPASPMALRDSGTTRRRSGVFGHTPTNPNHHHPSV